MRIVVSTANPIPLYQQISEQIKAKILSGELRPGDPLPSIRQLAADILASVITTKRAYSDLEAEGLIITRQGLGTFVADIGPLTVLRIKRDMIRRSLAEAVKTARDTGMSDPEILNLMRTVLYGRDTDHGANS